MTVTELRAVLDLATKSLAAVTTELRVEMKDVPKAVDLLIVRNTSLQWRLFFPLPERTWGNE